MLLQYITDVGGIAVEKTMLEAAMMEFFVAIILCLILFFIWFFRIPKPTHKWFPLVKKFFSEDKWRIVSITLILAALHFLILSPYVLYKQNQSKIINLTKTNKGIQSDVLLYKEALRQFGRITFDEWSNCGYHSFLNHDWELSLKFYDLSFNDPDERYSTPRRYQEVRNYPLYFCDLLKINQDTHTNTLQPDEMAIRTFRKNLADMTNDIYRAVVKTSINDAYNSKSQLKNTIINLELIKVEVPSSEKDYVQVIIDAISAMTNRATVTIP